MERLAELLAYPASMCAEEVASLMLSLGKLDSTGARNLEATLTDDLIEFLLKYTDE